MTVKKRETFNPLKVTAVKVPVSFPSTTKGPHTYHVQTQVSMVVLAGVLGIVIISKIGGAIAPHLVL